MNLRSARKLFARAPATHRPMARWLWNDHLDPDRLVSQLDRLLDMGLGGALIRPGKGLPPATYLSDAWFEAMNAVVRRARKRHASIWIAEDFDDPWTQEIMRGITAETPKFAAQMLRMTESPGINPAPIEPGSRSELVGSISQKRAQLPEPTAVFRIAAIRGAKNMRFGSDDPLSLERVSIKSLENASPDVDLLHFSVETHADRLTLVQSDASRALFNATHQRYFTDLKRYFGNTLGLAIVLGVGLPTSDGVIPWDSEVPHLFRETYGYDLIEQLPLLFHDLPRYEQVRFDFWTLLSEMLDEGFATPFERWCDERKTPGALGLVTKEGIVSRAVRGGSSMWLTAGFAFNVVTSHDWRIEFLPVDDQGTQCAIEVGEARSLKRQIDRAGAILLNGQRRLEAGLEVSEVSEFTVNGLGAEFHEGPPVLSSLRGGRRNALKTPLLVESVESTMLNLASDASARLTWVSTLASWSGVVLLLEPISSLQAATRPLTFAYAREELRPHDAIVRHFSSIVQKLSDEYVDFDFGDEQILARHGSVEGRELKVGRARYSVVVVPPSVNLRASTLALLQDYAMVGGLVLAVGTVPEMIEGRPSEAVKRFFAEYTERIVQGVEFGDYGALVDRLVQLGARSVAALGEGGETRPAIYVRRGRWESVEVVSAVNGGWDDERVTMEWVPEVRGIVESWDPVTGRTEPIATCQAGVIARVPLELAGGAAKLLVVAPGDPNSAEIDTRPWVEHIRLTPEWFGKRMRPNACVLTECRSGHGAGDWSTVDVQREALATAIDAAEGSSLFATEWRFFVDSGPISRDGWSVAVELGDDGSILLDGRSISTGDAKSLFDPAILQIRLPALPSGEHLLTINRSFAEAGDLQAPWLLGPFKLLKSEDRQPAIVATDESVPLGSWSEVGLPSYFGEVVYRAEVEGEALGTDERAKLEVESVGHIAEVRVNGKRAGTIFVRPFECDLTEHWGRGTRTIDIVVTEAPDNALAGLRGLDEFDTTHAGLIGKPEIVIYGRDGSGR